MLGPPLCTTNALDSSQQRLLGLTRILHLNCSSGILNAAKILSIFNSFKLQVWQ